jgi:WD40 repeat protein/predicted Ser/Thr protein kinase
MGSRGLAESTRALPRTERLAVAEELPRDRLRRYASTMANTPAAAQERSDLATDETQFEPPTTAEGALAERLTRDRIHRTLFGELATAPTIGRYTFLKELGEGGMGVVCTAYDPKLDRKVAIKLTRSLASASAERRGRILREAQAMARLSHPNVVQVYEVGELRDELFVAMEFIDGVDLSEWLAEAPRSWRDVQRVFLAAGRGLAAAHAAGLVHRDFKPANVFVGADGRVLVGDFGLARAADATVDVAPSLAGSAGVDLRTPLTATGALLGTPAYMAPESLERNVSDAWSDQFAFSIALFEALYGVRPFPARDVASLLQAILHAEPTVPADSDVPGWLQRIVLRGLRKRPSERWPSMDALLAALAFDPVARARGIRRAVALVSVATASVLGFGWLAADARERAEQEEAAKLAAEAARDGAFDDLRVEAERSQAEASRARDALRLAALRRFDSLGPVEHVDDPTSVAALLREVEAPEQLRGWRLSAVEALEEPIAAVVLPGWKDVAFTPDGARVVTQNRDESVSVARTDGRGAPVTFGALAGNLIGGLALSPDGQRVAIGYRDGLVHVHPIDGDRAPLELRGPGHQVTGLSWRDDSRQLLVNSWDKQKPGTTIRVSQRWDLDSSAAWVDIPGDAAFMPTGGLMVTTANPSSMWWGPQRDAGVWRSDGSKLIEFPGAVRIEAAPTADAVLAILPRALQRRGLDGSAIGAPFDHAALLGADATVVSAKFTPNGARVISTTSEDRVFVWDVASAKLLRELDAPPPPQAGMLQWGLQQAVSPDGALFARGYADRTVRVWDIDGAHAPMVLRGHLHEPSQLEFSPDSRTLATSTIYVRGFSKTEGLQRERGDFEHTIRLWPIPAARTVRFSAYTTPTTEANTRWISFSPWTPDGRALVLTDELTLRLVDAAGEIVAPPVTLPAHHEYLREPIFTTDGFVNFETADHWARWNLRDPSQVATIAKPPRDQQAVSASREHGGGATNLSRDGVHVYYLSPARDRIDVRRLDGHALVRRIDHDAKIERVEFSPQGDRIMTVDKDRRIRVWSLAGDAPPAVFAADRERVAYSLWSPDGGFVLVAVGTAVKDEFAFHVWRPGESGAADLRISAPAVVPLTRLSPDGRHLVIVGRDDRVRMISTVGELTVTEFDPVDSEPGRLEFSPDGAWLISRATHAAYIWSTATGAFVRVLRSPGRHLSLANFDPTGTRVLLGARDGTLTIAPFDPALALADLSQRLRAATSYCYSYERRRIDLGEPPTLAWANFASCERSQGRAPGEPPADASP